MDRTLDESSEALCPKVYVIQKFSFSLWLDKLKQIERKQIYWYISFTLIGTL